MSWTYHQKTGALLHDGQPIDHGYSGHGEGKNNPAMEAVRAVGPIPVGKWRATALREKGASTGPYTIVLMPVGHDAHGRTEFRVHGDSISDPGNASHGCIIMRRATRELFWRSGDHDLEVLP